jgi:hypothetical protein
MKKLISIGLLAGIFVGGLFGVFLLWRGNVIELGEGVLGLSVEALVVRPLDKIRQPSGSALIASGYNDIRGRKIVPCQESQDSTAVVVTFGQSNAANISPRRRRGVRGLVNFNFLDGKCYAAADPLLGAGGEGGALWTVLGNTLITRDVFKRVILVPLAVGGTSVNRWSDRNDLGRRLDRLAASLRSAALSPTHILWQQGAADHLAAVDYARLRPSEFTRSSENDRIKPYTMREDAYTEHFRSIVAHLRELGLQAPVFVSVSTVCGDDGSGPVADAQAALPTVIAGVRAGPDINAFSISDYHQDHCHLSDQGVVRAGKAWTAVLALAAGR